ncbi:hypothetical protein NBH81_03575 [Aeromonas veronii]|uniref:hypothetical protein n=1 Tax=Aeromonas veronii TaxID=654 RepID=UPI0021DAE70E|nr:hypothetical protein [Aeromonas veronii]UYB71591.1 hypothetical protein NBH81_03575 [Aeromonas veronii]
MEQDNRGKWVADGIDVLLPQRSGGFSLFGCPTPELHVRRIVASVNALSHLSIDDLESLDSHGRHISISIVSDRKFSPRRDDELLVALEKLRGAFVMAAGDKSPFAKSAIQMADEAIAKAKG